MGRTGITKHLIDTGSHRPIRQSLRRHPLLHQQVIKEQMQLMLKQNFIEPALSGWSSNVVLVRKKTDPCSFALTTGG